MNLKESDIEFSRFGERSILINFPAKIDENQLLQILKLKESIELKYIEEILYINHTYNSLIITYVSTIDNINDAFLALKSLLNLEISQDEIEFFEWQIPVCYDVKFGLDLNEISKRKSLDISQIIKKHTSPIYTVYFIGFLPGFLYLGGLDDSLIMDRKSQPRLNIQKGAVGIGGSQTGIYPSTSPGGWNIIGNSPIEFFNPNIDNPCFAKSGDKIRFYEVSWEEYQDIQAEVDSDKFIIKKKVIG
ncbi:inhibitor of KinA [Flavobacteriaceae bacterium MAR_2010_188]|nr:inhibitor of KinA [Flavobacteriaceae bacterium MAR_2010_188]